MRKIRGRGSVALRLFGLAFAASLALSVAAQSGAPAVMTREQLQKLLDESGTVMTNLATARTQQLPKDVADKRDKRGRGIQDDLQKNVMSSETEARLKALRESAAKDLAAGDLPGVQVTLVNLRRELTSEIERYQAIVAYWREIGAPGYPLAVVDESFLRAHRVEPAYAKELADLRAQIEKQVGAGDFVTAMQTTWPTYENTLRRKAVEESRRIVTSIDSGGFTELRAAKPTKPCNPATTTSGDTAPTPRSDFPRTIDYFPQKLKGLGIASGRLDVFVVVNAHGCAERAIVIRPAEYQEFDEAGLALAVDGHYLPAAKGPAAAAGTSEGVRGGLFLRVEFDSTG